MNIDLSEFGIACACGKKHCISVKEIVLGSGVLSELPAMLGRLGCFAWKQTILCDKNTFKAAGEAVCALLPNADCVILEPDGLHADEHGVDAAEKQLAADTGLLLAVGSGTIHDITRYIAAKKEIPFLSVPTAASVDGFVSTVAAMTWKGFKKTFPAVAPLGVIADSAVFSRAPFRLTASGVGDLLGKYTAVADWRISSLVTGEYLCERVCGLELDALSKMCRGLDGLSLGELKSYEQLMYGLLLSGLAMQMVGNSRPASGAEHHLSHLWEMEVLNGRLEAFHGQKVGVGLMLCAQVYRKAELWLRTTGFETQTRGLEMVLLQSAFEKKEMQKQILEENTPNPLTAVLPEELKRKALAIAEVLKGVPSPLEIGALLEKVGGVRTMEEIGLDAKLRVPSLRLSPYVRNRLTFLRILKCFSFYSELMDCWEN